MFAIALKELVFCLHSLPLPQMCNVDFGRGCNRRVSSSHAENFFCMLNLCFHNQSGKVLSYDKLSPTNIFIKLAKIVFFCQQQLTCDESLNQEFLALNKQLFLCVAFKENRLAKLLQFQTR